MKHTLPLLLATAAFCLASAPATAAGEAPYPHVWMGDKGPPVTEGWYKQCMAVAQQQPPAADLPAPADAAALAKQPCDAQTLYYDARHDTARADWTAVRHCAFATQDHAVLMMLYANGFGVPRNRPLSIHHACRTDSALAETRERVPHLAALKATETFDQCDDITSGMMMGLCESIHERQVDKERQRRKAMLTKDFSAAEREAFTALDTAARRYAELRGDKETDLSGTARAAMSIAASAQVLDEFLKDLETFEQGRWKVATEAQWAAADKRLNAAYRQVVKPGRPAAAESGTDVRPDGIQATQRAWLAYRDAWVAFARTRYQLVQPWVVSTLLTQRRTALLEEMKGS